MTDDKNPSDSTQDIKNRIQDFKNIHEDTPPKTPQNQGNRGWGYAWQLIWLPVCWWGCLLAIT